MVYKVELYMIMMMIKLNFHERLRRGIKGIYLFLSYIHIHIYFLIFTQSEIEGACEFG